MCCDDNSLTFVLQILTGNKAGLVESIPLLDRVSPDVL